MSYIRLNLNTSRINFLNNSELELILFTTEDGKHIQKSITKSRFSKTKISPQGNLSAIHKKLQKKLMESKLFSKNIPSMFLIDISFEKSDISYYKKAIQKILSEEEINNLTGIILWDRKNEFGYIRSFWSKMTEQKCEHQLVIKIAQLIDERFFFKNK